MPPPRAREKGGLLLLLSCLVVLQLAMAIAVAAGWLEIEVAWMVAVGGTLAACLLMASPVAQYVARLRPVPALTQSQAVQRRDQRLLGLAQETGGMGFLVHDFNTGVLVWTPGLSGLLGRPAARFESGLAEFLDSVHEDDREPLRQALQRALAECQGAVALACRVVLADGGSRCLSMRLAVRYDEVGAPQEMLGVAIDTTDQQRAAQAELALAQSEHAAADLADAANRARNEFVAMLGHELRNPLSAIAGGVELMQRQGVSETLARGARDIIARQTRNLSHMLADLLDVTGAVSGKLALVKHPLDVDLLLNRLVRTLQLAGTARPGRISVDAQALWIDADVARLEQIVTHLVGNALKYTPEDTPIRIEARREGEQAVLRIVDEGAGISPELLPQVFDLFTQGERPLDRRAGGLGLGLALTRHLVELHGGAISVSSSAAGSCFEVRLPLTEAPETQAEASGVPAAGRQRVLVVEDNLDAQRTLCDLLKLDGHLVTAASDGAQGLDVLVHQRPEIAIVDIGLPRLDGFEVALRARAAGYGGRLIAVSGYGHATDAQRALKAGFDAHMAKPVNTEQLRRLMNPG